MNLKLFSKAILLTTFLVNFASIGYSQQLAFPSADGGGKFTTGGRGGNVVIVKSLGDFGGALKSSGPKTIVFRVSGTIKGNFHIPDNTTIAGQTAPGDGICLNGSVTMGSNVIVRYIRIRGQPSYDCLGAREKKNIIVDHVSTSFSRDENLSVYHNDNATIQWCLISEAMGGDHGFAGIWGGNMNTQHHNLIAHNNGRNPRFCGGAQNNDYRNNVLYNWGKHPTKGGEDKQNFDDKGIWVFSAINFVANYYKPGPYTAAIGETVFCMPGGGSWYVKDNVMHDDPALTADNWKGFTGGKKRSEPAPHVPMTNQQTAEEAYKSVLQYAGCSFPKRDALDERVVSEVAAGTASKGNKGMVTSISQVGGMPTLNSAPAPADSDNDGMPDAWEKANGLNPNDPKDQNGKGAGGYTNIENYINSLVSDRTGITTPAKQEMVSHGLHLTRANSHAINYSFPARSTVKLELFAITGKKVALLINEVKEAGNYSVDYSSLNLGTGPYICRLSSGNTAVARNIFITQ